MTVRANYVTLLDLSPNLDKWEQLRQHCTHIANLLSSDMVKIHHKRMKYVAAINARSGLVVSYKSAHRLPSEPTSLSHRKAVIMIGLVVGGRSSEFLVPILQILGMGSLLAH